MNIMEFVTFYVDIRTNQSSDAVNDPKRSLQEKSLILSQFEIAPNSKNSKLLLVCLFHSLLSPSISCHFFSTTPFHFFSSSSLRFFSSAFFISSLPNPFVSSLRLPFVSSLLLPFISSLQLHFISALPLPFVSSLLLPCISSLPRPFVSSSSN